MKRLFKKRMIGFYVFILVLCLLSPGYSEFNPNNFQPNSPQASSTGATLDFQTNEFTGTFGYSYSFEGPPARRGFAPSLAVGYGSGGGNGLCGVGWSFGAGSIVRDGIKGVPIEFDANGNPLHYDDAKGFMLSFLGVSTRLIKIGTDGSTGFDLYGPQVLTAGSVTFNRIEYTGTYWIVTDRSGGKHYFGEDPSCRVENPNFPAGVGTSVYEWPICRSRDVYDNQITYTYFNNGGVQYLDQVSYNENAGPSPLPATCFYKCVYELRPDPLVSYRSGFRQETTNYLKEVQTFLDVPNVTTNLVNRTVLSYIVSPSTGRSLLNEIRSYGRDGLQGGSSLPPLTFGYTTQTRSFADVQDWGTLYHQPVAGDPNFSANRRPFHALQFRASSTDWLRTGDMNRDGIVDRVVVDNSGDPYLDHYLVQLGTPNSGFMPTHDEYHFQRPSEFFINLSRLGWEQLIIVGNGTENRLSLADLNGDGLWERIHHPNFPATDPANVFGLYVEMGTGIPDDGNAGNGQEYAFDPTPNESWIPFDQNLPGTGPWNAYGYSQTAFGAESGMVVTSRYDLNGDGLSDRMIRHQNAPFDEYLVQINTGSGYEPIVQKWDYPDAALGVSLVYYGYAETYETAFQTTISGSTPKMLADMNGDGLPDIVRRMVDDAPSGYLNYKVFYNTGSGFDGGVGGQGYDFGPLVNPDGTSGSRWRSPGEQVPLSAVQGFFSAGPPSWTRMLLMDINCDGLPDRVMANDGGNPANEGSFAVQLNRGGTGFSPTLVYFDNIDQFGREIFSNNGYRYPQASRPFAMGLIGAGSETYRQLMDINGDGLIDVVSSLSELYADFDVNNWPQAQWQVQLGEGDCPDLLTTVNNGIGGVVMVEYKPSTAYDNTDGTSNLGQTNRVTQTVCETRVNDGLGNPERITTYTYRYGRFDYVEREGRGFGYVEVTDPEGAKRCTWYHQGGGFDGTSQGEYLDEGSRKYGRSYCTQIKGNDGNPYQTTYTRWDEVVWNNGQTVVYASQTAQVDDTGQGLGHTRSKVQEVNYDLTEPSVGDPAKLTVSKQTNWGEVINFSPLGHTYNDVNDDTLYTFFYYFDPIYFSTHGFVDKLETTHVTLDPNDAGVFLRESVMSYHPTGDPYTEASWLDTTQSYLTSWVFYDVYGNANAVVDSDGVQTDIVYDPTYQTFPITETADANGLAFQTQYTIDPKSGQMLFMTDVKGTVNEYRYDTYDRLLESLITPVDGAQTWVERYVYNLGGTDPFAQTSDNYVCRHVNDGVDLVNGHQTFVYSNGMGEEIQTRVEAETGEYRTTNKLFDFRGNVVFESRPYFSAGVAYTNDPPIFGTNTDYDPVGRVIRITPPPSETNSPTGPIVTQFYEGVDPWARVVQDANLTQAKQYYDAYGRLIRVTEQIDDVPSWTDTVYVYDSLSQLKEVHDDLGNLVINLNYDSLGRKTYQDHMNLGVMTSQYDNANRLVFTQDAVGNTVSISYDNLGRIQSRHIFNFGSSTIDDEFFTYDISDDPLFTVYPGQLYKVESPTSQTRNSYDGRDRVVKIEQEVAAVGNQAYTAEMTYDEAGHIRFIQYPVNPPFAPFRVEQVYNTGGTLQSIWVHEGISGPLPKEIYVIDGMTASGLLTGFDYGNGDETRFTYYANVDRIQNIRSTRGSEVWQDVTYWYDAVSNPIEVIDNRYVAPDPASGSYSNILYDRLQRLKSWTNPVTSTIETFSYDTIGNILVNTESGSTDTYTYYPDTHQVATAGGKTYAYDANGNVITRGDQTLTYDGRNRLLSVFNSSTNKTVSFTYDHTGQRLTRQVDSEIPDVYIGAGIYEEKGGKILCHVRAGNRRIFTCESLRLRRNIGQSN